MNGDVLLRVLIIAVPLALILGVVIGYFYKQNQIEKAGLRLKDKAEKTLGLNPAFSIWFCL